MARLWRWAYNSDHNSGVRIVNTGYVVTTEDFGGGGDGSAAQVRDALHGALTTKYRAMLAADFTVQSLVIREQLKPGDTDVPEEAAQTIASAGTSTGTGDRLPLGCCMLVSIYTNAAIRSGHGRRFVYPGGYASALTSAGIWDPSGGGIWAAVAAFEDEAKLTHSVDTGFGTTATAHPVVYSRTRHGLNLDPWYFDITSYTRRPQPHWLRSRMTAP